MLLRLNAGAAAGGGSALSEPRLLSPSSEVEAISKRETRQHYVLVISAAEDLVVVHVARSALEVGGKAGADGRGADGVKGSRGAAGRRSQSSGLVNNYHEQRER